MSLLVRAACLTHYSDVARAGGLDPAAMLKGAGLSAQIEETPDLLIPVDRVGHLLHASATLSGNEAFGLCMAEPRRLSNLGVVGLLVRDQPTLRDCLEVLMRHQHALNGSLSLMLEETGGWVVLRERLRAGRPQQPTRQRVELALGVMVRLMRQYLGEDWVPQQVHVEHTAPAALTVHHRVLGHGLRFGADFNGIVCTTRDLDTRNPAADPTMVRYAQMLLPSTGMAVAGGGVHGEVRRAVLDLLPTGACTLSQVCTHLGLSRRTTQRALADQGLSFSSVLNEVRREEAACHVLHGQLPLTEVSMLLGFSAPSTFSRWYQAQFGQSAKAHRASGRRAGPPLASA